MSAGFILCVVVLGIQIIYLTLFLFAFSTRLKAKTSTSLWPPLSVVVCAHNEEVNLKELLPILMRQNHPDFEVIIVDDRSVDGTAALLEQWMGSYAGLRAVKVTHVPEGMQGKKFGLTQGIQAARNEWVLLTDADCRPTTDHWIKEMSSHFREDKDIVIGFSPYEKRNGWLNSFIRFECFATAIQYMSFAVLGRPYMGVGRNMAYRKSLFLERKGFTRHMAVTGGDDDLFVNGAANKTNLIVAIGKNVLVRSIPKEGWKAFFYQKVRHLSAGKKYRLADRLLLGMFSATWILSWFCLLLVFGSDNVSKVILLMFILRGLLVVVLFSFAPRRLGEPLEAWKVPFLDFNYAFYYLVTGVTAFFSNTVRWKI